MNDEPDSAVILWVVAGSGALVPLALGQGALGSIAGALTPVAVQQVSGLARRVLRRRFDNTAKALRIAADLHQVGLDIFTERLAEDDSDERIELLARVIQAAASATFPAKVEALGRVLADGVMEDGDAAEALVLARAIESLDPAHVVVLDHLERHRVPAPEMLEAKTAPSAT